MEKKEKTETKKEVSEPEPKAKQVLRKEGKPKVEEKAGAMSDKVEKTDRAGHSLREVAKPVEKKAKKTDCNDSRCPIHGSLSTYGYKFKGIVVSDKMEKSAVVEREFVRKVTKYMRYEKRTTRVSAHNPECINAKVGDRVVVQECRPLSKTKNFVILERAGEK